MISPSPFFTFTVHVHSHITSSLICLPGPYLGLEPGRVVQSVGHLTRKSGVPGSIPGLATYFRFSFRLSRRAGVSYWRKYVQEVLVDRLGGLSLPRKSVVRLTGHPDMTLDVYRGRKTTIQQQQQPRPRKEEKFLRSSGEVSARFARISTLLFHEMFPPGKNQKLLYKNTCFSRVFSLVVPWSA